MDLSEFVDRFERILASLSGRLDAAVLDDVAVYLETGEEGLAAEFLLGGLVRRKVPVTANEAGELLELLHYFPQAASDPEDFYSALVDPDGTVAELTVVDGPAS